MTQRLSPTEIGRGHGSVTYYRGLGEVNPEAFLPDRRSSYREA